MQISLFKEINDAQETENDICGCAEHFDTADPRKSDGPDRVDSGAGSRQRSSLRNSNMVIAYWLIGREIVEALQSGEGRAEYGESLLADLSEQLSKRYGRSFSATNLRYFRLFYQVFSDRRPEIHHSTSDELAVTGASATTQAQGRPRNNGKAPELFSKPELDTLSSAFKS